MNTIFKLIARTQYVLSCFQEWGLKGYCCELDHATLLNEWTLNFTYSPFKYKNLWIFQTVGLVKQSFLFPLVHFQSLYKYRVTLKYLNCKDDIRLLKNDDTKVKLALLMASWIIWQIFKLHQPSNLRKQTVFVNYMVFSRNMTVGK